MLLYYQITKCNAHYVITYQANKIMKRHVPDLHQTFVVILQYARHWMNFLEKTTFQTQG